MTLLVILDHCPTEEDMKEVEVTISEDAADMDGTSGHLREGDVLTVWDLAHAMMLPSGNDAAVTLAETFGADGEVSNFVK